MNNKTRVIVYTRTSTANPTLATNQHEAQFNACADYCAEHGLTIVGLTAETGGFETADPTIELINQKAKEKNVQSIVCSDVTRISRRTERTQQVIEIFNENGITVQFTKN